VGAVWCALVVVACARLSRWVPLGIFAVVLALLLYVVLAAPLRRRRTERITEFVGAHPELAGQRPRRLGTALRISREAMADEDPEVRRRLRLCMASALGAAALFAVLSIVLTR
jgi:hypothetical protein